MRDVALVGALLMVCLGCGSNAPFKYVPVEGSVSYEDGGLLPASGIQLKFISLDAPAVEGASPRPAVAHVNSDGKFERVTSYKYGDGLVPGRHKVAVLYAKDKQGRLLVPKEYSSTQNTPLVVDTATAPLVIKIPKP